MTWWEWTGGCKCARSKSKPTAWNALRSAVSDHNPPAMPSDDTLAASFMHTTELGAFLILRICLLRLTKQRRWANRPVQYVYADASKFLR